MGYARRAEAAAIELVLMTPAGCRRKTKEMETETANNFRPWDLIRLRDRCWRVTGNYLGGLNQEDLVGLTVEDGRTAGTASGRPIGEMMVPVSLLFAALASGEAIWFRPIKLVRRT